jgi:hypothetical protein
MRDGGGHRQDFLPPNFVPVLGPAAAVTVAREVERGDAVILGQQRADVVPPPTVGAATVNENKAGLGWVSPAAKRDKATCEFQGMVFDRLVQG